MGELRKLAGVDIGYGQNLKQCSSTENDNLGGLETSELRRNSRGLLDFSFPALYALLGTK